MAAQATYIVDILDEHLEELGFLWGQWRAALSDADYTLAGVADLEERIRAHLQGVQVPGERAWPRLIELLDGDDADLVFAAAYALLHCNVPDHTGRVLGKFATLEGDLFRGATMALAHGPLPPAAIERVRTLLSAQPAIRALAAAEVLAFHGALELSGDQLRYFLEHEDAATRVAGWRIAALVGAQLPPTAYAAALRDAEGPVTTAALEAGAWCGVQGVLPALRQIADPAAADQLDRLYLLAVVGSPDDAPRMQAALDAEGLGPARFTLAGAFGSPLLMPAVLAALESPDPATAAAAGAAFTRLTGVDIGSGQRADVPPKDGAPSDEFEAEFQEEVMLPDAAKARREWDRLRPQLEPLPRVCRGVDAARALDAGVSALIDMQSRREAHLRARLQHAWSGTLLQLERFPQGRSAVDEAATRAPDRSPSLVTAAH